MTYRKVRCIRDSRGVRIMVFNATFNNISVLIIDSWPSVLLVEEMGENHDLPQVTDKLTTDSYFIIINILHFTRMT
jgi:hypothetical protein